jgi:hypothetical protein
MNARLRRAAGSWNGFWFTPSPATPLAFVRIAFGLVVTAWTLSLRGDGDFGAFFQHDGILPATNWHAAPSLVSLLRIWDGDGATTIVFLLLLVSSILLTLGLFTRVAALAVFIGIMSFERRNPFLFNSGDGLLRLLALYLVFAPSGAYLSLDRWRRDREHFWEVPLASSFALRLMQIQLSALYIGSVWAKLSGGSWNDGTAVSYALRTGDLHRFGLPGFLSTSLLMSNLETFGTLAIESALAFLVWNRRLRPWVLGAGVILHLAISYGIRVGFFSLGIFTLYLAFLTPTAAQWIVDALRGSDPEGATETSSPG